MANNKITYKDVFANEEWDKPTYPCWSIRVGEEGDFERYEIGQEEEIIIELNRIKENIAEYIEDDYEEEDITITLFYELDENCIRTYYMNTIEIKKADDAEADDEEEEL